MSKVVKQMELDALSKAFGKVRDFVFLTSSKVDAALDYNFRKTLREKKIRVQMVKNTLARKVLKDNGIEVNGVWEGTTLLAWGGDSIKGLSTTIDNLLTEIGKKEAKNKDKIKVKGPNGGVAVADGQQVPFGAAKTMPTRLEAIGEIIGMILAPASAIAGCLTGPAAQVASQVATIAERKEDAAPAPAAS
jgi:large subunit ribosomal protein L10